MDHCAIAGNSGAGSSGGSAGGGSSGGSSGAGSLPLTSALCTLTPLMLLTSTLKYWSSRLQIVYSAVYGSSYDNHPLSQKLDPRLIIYTTPDYG